MKLSVGAHAPDFTLSDQNGIPHTLSTYQGSWVLLYFYPKDNTPGCTTEACSLRDTFQDFRNANLIILGVSIDTSKSHKKFVEKNQLPFSLLADEQKHVVQLYDVWQKKKFLGKEYRGILRTSFLIDPTGVIKKIYEKVKPENHAREVLQDIQSFSTM